MRKLYGFLALFVLMASSVFATVTTLSPDNLAMASTDVKIVQFCMNSSLDHLVPIVGATLVVGDVCQDVNGLEGCQFPADTDKSASGDQFDVTVLNDALTDANGCEDVQLDTDLAGGVFYYTINGHIGAVDSTPDGSETGRVFVP